MKNREIFGEPYKDFEADPLLQCIYDALKNQSSQPKMLNVRRYYQMLHAKAALDDLLKQSWECATSSIKFMPMFSSASLFAEAESFEVTDMDAFGFILDLADNLEFVPLTNGKLRLAFVFKNMMETIE